MSQTYIGLNAKYPLFLSDFDETWIFSSDFPKKKNPQLSSSIKLLAVEAELFHADRQRDTQ